MRNIGIKLDIPKTTVCRIKKKYLDMTAFVKLLALKYVRDKEIQAKRGCRKVYNKVFKKIVIIDNKSSILVDPASYLASHIFMRTNVVMQINSNLRRVFSRNALIFTIHFEIYFKKYIKNWLIPFIQNSTVTVM